MLAQASVDEHAIALSSFLDELTSLTICGQADILPKWLRRSGPPLMFGKISAPGSSLT